MGQSRHGNRDRGRREIREREAGCEGAEVEQAGEEMRQRVRVQSRQGGNRLQGECKRKGNRRRSGGDRERVKRERRRGSKEWGSEVRSEKRKSTRSEVRKEGEATPMNKKQGDTGSKDGGDEREGEEARVVEGRQARWRGGRRWGEAATQGSHVTPHVSGKHTQSIRANPPRKAARRPPNAPAPPFDSNFLPKENVYLWKEIYECK